MSWLKIACVVLAVVGCGGDERESQAGPPAQSPPQPQPALVGSATKRSEPLHIVDLQVGAVVLSDGRIRLWGGTTATPREYATVPGAKLMRRGLVVTTDGRVLHVHHDGDKVVTERVDAPPTRTLEGWPVSGDIDCVGIDGKLTIENDREKPKPVIGLSDVVQASPYGYALLGNGKVIYWNRDTPTEVDALPPASQMVPYADSVCVLAKSGGLGAGQQPCMGCDTYNSPGQGNGYTEEQPRQRRA